MMLLLAAVTAATAVMLVPCSVAMAVAEPTSPEGPTPAADREATVCTTSAAAAVAEAAQQICGSAPIDEALLSVRLRPEAAEDVGWMLAGRGFRQALDLQLLAGWPEAAVGAPG